MQKLAYCLVAIGLVVSLVLTGCAPKEAAPAPAPAPAPPVAPAPTPSPTPTGPLTVEQIATLQLGPERQRILEEGARKEGKLMLYTAATGYDIVAKRFMQKYPFIKMDVFTTRVAPLQERTLAEAKAGKLGGDVVTGPVALFVPLDDVLAQFNSVGASFGTHPKGADVYAGLIVFTYSTERVAPADVPKHINDLLRPRWKGKLGLFSPPNTWPALWTGMVVEYLSETEAKNFLSKLGDQRPFFYAGPAQGQEATLTGQTDINMQGSTNALRTSALGAPLDWVSLEPTMGYSNMIGIFNKAQHPYSAMLYIDWMLSPEGREVVKGLEGIGGTLMKDIEQRRIRGTRLAETVRMQTPADVAQLPKWTELFRELVMKK